MTGRPDGLPEHGQLVGREIFLSASVPARDRAERYHIIPNAQEDIERAVISVARAIFVEGGALVFGGHPSISPLVSLVAGEYFPARPERNPETRPVIIYQLDVFRRLRTLPLTTEGLETSGRAAIVWEHVSHKEQERPHRPGTPRYWEPLTRMRDAMLSRPRLVAMIAMGGMEGVEQELDIFAHHHPGRPVFVLAHTGGAAAIIARQRDERKAGKDIDVVDARVLGNFDRATPLRYAPYPVIAQEIVRALGKG
jgi:hypothetical protein